MAKRKTEVFTLDYRVKNPEHLPKAMGSAWAKVLKSRLPKIKVMALEPEWNHEKVDRTGALKVIDLVFTDPKHKSVTDRFVASDVKRFVGS